MRIFAKCNCCLMNCNPLMCDFFFSRYNCKCLKLDSHAMVLGPQNENKGAMKDLYNVKIVRKPHFSDLIHTSFAKRNICAHTYIMESSYALTRATPLSRPRPLYRMRRYRDQPLGGWTGRGSGQRHDRPGFHGKRHLDAWGAR